MAKRVMILAGGTGGHVYPALAVARVLSKTGNQVFWMGTRNGLEAQVAIAYGFPIDWLSVSGFRGKHGLKLIKAPFLLIWACCQAGLILCRRRPDVVLGMGGFVSSPGGLMAWLMRIPMVIHEQNAIPGSTNRVLAYLAKRVLEAFPGTFDRSRRAVCTGNPVRSEIVQIRQETRKCSGKIPCILILGGSQGARRLNQCVPGVIERLNRKVEVYHQSGSPMKEQTEAFYRERLIEARVTAFVDDMAQAYQWADLVICRAGAMTISELAIAGLPAILVPFPYAIDDHQTRNAHYLVDARAAVLVPESDNLETDLANALYLLLDDPDRIRSMARAASRLAKPDAARAVADYCIGEAT
ncbi:MAG: undecaprenyldiphospho-muramoylpentapeptide beta-N-acetylglucosaminyltransferase [Methylococcaceae bacterium]|nr:undecaprenyldiphospho-muramoylpentapeptide beta-N-acetylglucosaminyltransferase [Methylococcaceae bacterium]